MGVKLYGHQSGDPDTPKPTDLAEFVATEFNQHHMLGLLFIIGQELAPEAFVIGGGRTTVVVVFRQWVLR